MHYPIKLSKIRNRSAPVKTIARTLNMLPFFLAILPLILMTYVSYLYIMIQHRAFDDVWLLRFYIVTYHLLLVLVIINVVKVSESTLEKKSLTFDIFGRFIWTIVLHLFGINVHFEFVYVGVITENRRVSALKVCGDRFNWKQYVKEIYYKCVVATPLRIRPVWVGESPNNSDLVYDYWRECIGTLITNENGQKTRQRNMVSKCDVDIGDILILGSKVKTGGCKKNLNTSLYFNTKILFKRS